MRGFLGKTRGQKLFNALILLVLAVAIYLSFKPYIETSEFRLDEVREMDSKISPVSAENVVEMLRGNDRPVMLVVYASWCPICRQLMPEVTGLMQEGRLERVIPVFLSVDAQPRELGKYLVYQDYHRLFAPYIIEQTLLNRLPAALQATGSHFNGGIPYVGFFDSEGKMLSEYSGLMTKETLLSRLP